MLGTSTNGEYLYPPNELQQLQKALRRGAKSQQRAQFRRNSVLSHTFITFQIGKHEYWFENNQLLGE